MKHFFSTLVLLFSTLTFAQFNFPDYAGILQYQKEVRTALQNSPEIKNIKLMVEKNYDVQCNAITPDGPFEIISIPERYVAKCTGKKNLKLVIRAKYYATEASYAFEVKSYSIKFTTK